jgi:hypothetical protein
MKYSLPALCFSLFKLSNEIVLRGSTELESEEIKDDGDDEVKIKL